MPEKIADVGVLGDFAYLAAWGVRTCKYNGVHVVDISDVQNPKEVAFVGSKEGSYPGEASRRFPWTPSSSTARSWSPTTRSATTRPASAASTSTT